jgi:hypothetical protein
MPVWDPELNPPDPSGNPYLGWARVVAVDPKNISPGKTAAVQFIGRSFPQARRVRLEAFHHVAVDAAMAKQLALDPESNRTAIIALGRPIAVNDQLALVGINMMTHEQHDWVWDNGVLSTARVQALHKTSTKAVVKTRTQARALETRIFETFMRELRKGTQVS